jgi:hypothetical protein
VCGPEADCGGVERDSSISPGPAWGEEEGPDRRAPLISVREGRKEGARGRLWAGGAQLGPEEREGGAGRDGPRKGGRGERGRASWAAQGREKVKEKWEREVGRLKREREGERKKEKCKFKCF